MTDVDVNTELQEGNKLLKQQRYVLLEKVESLEAENKRLKAMYDAAKGDLEDSLRGHNELVKEFANVQDELILATRVIE